MSELLPVPVALLLVGAAINVLVGRVAVRRIVTFTALVTVLGYAALAVVATYGGRILVNQVGGWPAPFAIPLVVDTFSALMLVVAALMLIVCTVFAVARAEDEHRYFHSLVLVVGSGVSGSFMTADLFNLFVFFEVMLVASYVLITLRSDREQTRAGAVYIATNLLASTILLIGVGLIYATAGSVNMAVLAGLTPDDEIYLVAGSLLLVAFAIKSALVPVHGWLPTAYPAAGPAVAALFSGLLTKVGIYAIYRVYSIAFQGDPQIRPVLIVIAGVSMLVGVIAAFGEGSMRRILSFHIVSQVGYMIMGLALFGPIGLAAGIFYILHHIIVKTSLFLAAGAVETTYGTGALNALGGLRHAHPVLAASFFLAALSLAGVPPLSGFFAKLGLITSALDNGQFAIAGIALLVGLITLASMLKIWRSVFSGDPVEGERSFPPRRTLGLIAPAASLAIVAVVLGLSAEGMFRLADSAAGSLLDAREYVTAVLLS